MGLGFGHKLLKVEPGRIGRHLRQFGLIAQQVVDLVVKHQRQAGEGEQQQEYGADQAGPGVDEGPAADGFAFHCLAFRCTKAALLGGLVVSSADYHW